jgi:uncharacterized protein YbjQ (UPF0145 family)
MIPSWGLGQNMEIKELSSAMYEARRLAMGRLVSTANKVGGQGVVGVTLDINMFEGHNHLAVFNAMGTAVRKIGGGESSGHKHQPSCFTSDLSGQDFYLLLRAGYLPLGMVMGTCVYYVARQQMATWMRSQTQNIEIATYTSALYDARELAMGRMQQEALRLGADGIVGVKVAEQSHVWGSHVIEFFVLGTAVRLTGKEHRKLEPRSVLPLDDFPAVVF